MKLFTCTWDHRSRVHVHVVHAKLFTLSPPFLAHPPTRPISLLPAVRLEETIDMSTTVKFVYVHWMGKSVPFVKRGKFGVVQGSLEKQFSVSTKYTCTRLFDVEGLIFSYCLYVVLKFLSCLSFSVTLSLSVLCLSPPPPPPPPLSLFFFLSPSLSKPHLVQCTSIPSSGWIPQLLLNDPSVIISIYGHSQVHAVN